MTTWDAEGLCAGVSQARLVLPRYLVHIPGYASFFGHSISEVSTVHPQPVQIRTPVLFVSASPSYAHKPVYGPPITDSEPFPLTLRYGSVSRKTDFPRHMRRHTGRWYVDKYALQ